MYNFSHFNHILLNLFDISNAFHDIFQVTLKWTYQMV